MYLTNRFADRISIIIHYSIKCCIIDMYYYSDFPNILIAGPVLSSAVMKSG